VRTTTSMSSPNRSAISRLVVCATVFGAARLASTTFPLWRYVRTSSKPASAKASRSAGIAIRFVEPRLIPRSSTIRLAMAGEYGRTMLEQAERAAELERAVEVEQEVTALELFLY